MAISMQDIANIQNGGSYYLSDEGKIEKQGFLSKFKCFFNLGHSRERVQNLVNEIQRTLMNSITVVRDSTLNDSLSALNTKRGLKGDTIKGIFNSFKERHVSDINRKTVKDMISSESTRMIQNMVDTNPSIKSTPELKELCNLALKPILDDFKKNDNELNQEKMQNDIRNTLQSLANDIIATTKNSDLGNPEIDSNYAKYLKSALFTEKGKRTDLSVDNLKKPQDAYVDLFFSKLPKDKKEECKDILKQITPSISEMDSELIDLLTNGNKITSLFIAGSGGVRKPEDVQKRIDGFIDNLKEIQTLKKDDPKAAEIAYTMVKDSSMPLPSGALTQMYNDAKNMDLRAIKNLSPRSSVTDLHNAMFSLTQAKNDIVFRSAAKYYDASPEEMMNCNVYIFNIVLQQLQDKEKLSLINTLTSFSASRTMTIYENIEDYLPEKATENQKDKSRLLSGDIGKTMENLLAHSCTSLGIPRCRFPFNYIGSLSERETSIINDVLTHVVNSEDNVSNANNIN